MELGVKPLILQYVERDYVDLDLAQDAGVMLGAARVSVLDLHQLGYAVTAVAHHLGRLAAGRPRRLFHPRRANDNRLPGANFSTITEELSARAAA